MKHGEKGFTLIELAVSLAIIVLASGAAAGATFQVFKGTAIARKGSGISEVFTVRRIVNNEGVERIFPLHSPNVLDVHVKRSGCVRRSKLYFLRERTGKAVRLRERWDHKRGQ